MADEPCLRPHRDSGDPDGWTGLSRYRLHKVVFNVVWISLIPAALFQHAQIVPGVTFSVVEDDLHSK
jgi:hypothetical protein